MPLLSLPISAWSAWAPGLHSPQDWHEWSTGKLQASHVGNPELPFVDPMLRRRLGRWSRMAIHVAQHCLGERSSASVVFASRHADIAKTLGMLEDLAVGEMLSPTAFSLSVNNASMGMFSILRQLHGQSTAIAACAESFGYGLVEAVSRLNTNPDEALLYVYADDDLPDMYAETGHMKDDVTFFPHAIALLLESTSPVRIDMELESSSGAHEDSTPQSLAFMQVLSRAREQASWRGGQNWTWSSMQ